MSFVISVSRFLSVALRDETGADVTEFAIAPTTRTRALMSDYGIIFRAVTGGFALYYKTNPSVPQPLVSPISDQVRFSFEMTAAGPAPDKLFQELSGAAGAQVLLDNLDGAGAILPGGVLTAAAEVGAGDHVFAGPKAYPVRVDLGGGIPAQVEARDRFTDAVAAQAPVEDLAAEPPVAPPPGATEVFTTIDVPEAEAALRLVTPAPGTLDRLIYADDEIAQGAAVGIIDLFWSGAQSAVPAGTGIEYSAIFRRQ